jgi:hypothetical protein
LSEEKIEVSVEPRCLMIEGKRESKKDEEETEQGRSDHIFVERRLRSQRKVTATGVERSGAQGAESRESAAGAHASKCHIKRTPVAVGRF